MTTTKNIIYPLVSIFVLLMTGCHHDTATMQELSRIDTLLTMERQYEKALRCLDSLDTHSFNKAEQAYYSLLITQAHYKNYIDDTTDAVINLAVNYYQNSDDKEKATRSLLYKGCVYEVLGNYEKAADCYNRADETADKQDIANKAYAKLRIGVLYHENIVGANSIAVEKYFEALQLYRLLSDKHYELLCLTTIGSIYRDFKDIEKQDSALFYIDSALELAKEQNDTYFQFENLFIKAEFYELLKHEYLTAKNLAVQAINIGGKEIDHPRAHFCAAKSFVRLGQIDSAYYYLDHAPKLNTARDSIMYYNLLADIAQYKNNNELWLSYHNQAISMADSILISNLNAKLFNIEKKYDLQQKELKNVSLQSKLKGAWLTVALMLLAALSLFHFLWRYRNRLIAKENEYELLKSDLSTSLSSLEQMRDRLDEVESSHRNEELKAAFANQIQTVHQLLLWSYQHDEKTFARKFNEMMTMRGGEDESYWKNLLSLVNGLYNNVLVAAQEAAGGQLRDDEVNYLALYCCGFSRTVIMVCMDYLNIGTVYNKRTQIAKKLGVNNLDEFIAPFQEKRNNKKE